MPVSCPTGHLREGVEVASGQQAAAQLRQAADSGELSMSRDAAREIAQVHLRFTVRCDGWI